MAAEIHKLQKNGVTIYPATTTDAVVDPDSRKTIKEIILDINLKGLYLDLSADVVKESEDGAYYFSDNITKDWGRSIILRIDQWDINSDILRILWYDQYNKTQVKTLSISGLGTYQIDFDSNPKSIRPYIMYSDISTGGRVSIKLYDDAITRIHINEKNISDIYTKISDSSIIISNTSKNLNETINALSIYRTDKLGEEIIKSSDAQGRVSTSDSKVKTTLSNWDGSLYEVSAGDNLIIKINQTKKYLSEYALISFVESFTNNADATVIQDMSNQSNYEIIYSPEKKGYIHILHTVAGVKYADIIGIYKLVPGDYIDFNSLIGDLNNLADGIKSENIVEALNTTYNKIGSSEGIDIYREKLESDVDIYSSGNYRALSTSNIIEFVGDNQSANTYKVYKGKKYKLHSVINSSYPTFASAYYIKGTVITNRMECQILKVCDEDEYTIEFIPDFDGLLFMQTRIVSSYFDVSVKELILGDYIEFKKEIESLKNDITPLSPPIINIPDTVYAIVGDTLQLFFRSIISCIDLENYDIRFISDIGKSYPRYYEYTPTNQGEHNVEIEVRDITRKIIAKKSFKIKSYNIPSSPTVDTVIATFGDSLSAAGTWQKELNRRITSSDLENPQYPKGDNLSNISLIGTMENDGTKYFGIGGWAWSNYATESTKGWRFQVTGVSSLAVGATYTINGDIYTIIEVNITEGSGNILTRSNTSSTPPSSGTLIRTSSVGDESIEYSSVSSDAANPLWSNGKVSYIDYVTKCGKNKLDVVIFFLGWNILYVDLSPNEEWIRTLIETANSEYPGVKFVLLGVQLPSLNGGLAANYAQTSLLADLREIIYKVHTYNTFLKNIADEYDYVDYVDVASQFDSENNMPETSKNVNCRNTKTEYIGTNGVHPDNSGYYQISDIVYRYIMYILNKNS